MGLFDKVLQAIDDPNRQASGANLGQIFSTVQQLSQQQNASSDTMQQAVSILGQFVRSSLQETRTTQGEAAAQQLVNQGSQSDASVLGQLFSGDQQQRLAQTISEHTGLNSAQIRSMLPMLIPVVMKLLSSGSSNQPSEGNNTVLNAFLDADGDGDVDMGDMLKMAGRFAG